MTLTRLLVTGGTGFIGQHLVVRLLKRPNTAVTLLLREAYSHIDISPLPPALAAQRDRFNVVYADLRNFQLTARAVREATPDAVLHLAAAGVSEPFLGVETALRHNLNGTVNLVRACFENGDACQRLIVSRTPGELTNLNVYAASKAAAWNFCQMYVRTHGWPIVGAMVFQAYGPGQTERSLVPAAIRAALAGEAFAMTEGKQAKDWIFISDVVDGFLATLDAALAPGCSVDIGAGRPYSVAEVVKTIFDLVDGPGKPLFGALPTRPGEVPVQQANRTRTLNLTGWQSTVSLRDGLRQTIAYDKKHNTDHL